jgi:hypothetical protein
LFDDCLGIYAGSCRNSVICDFVITLCSLINNFEQPTLQEFPRNTVTKRSPEIRAAFTINGNFSGDYQYLLFLVTVRREKASHCDEGEDEAECLFSHFSLR